MKKVLVVFRTFHMEPLITQTRILNSAEPVDRFNFSITHLSATQFRSLYPDQDSIRYSIIRLFSVPTLSYRIKRQVLKKLNVLPCEQKNEILKNCMIIRVISVSVFAPQN